MKYRKLGSTGLNVSVVGVGTWQFGGEWGRSYDLKEADAILGRARELGINLIDTAECYGDHLSESLIGPVIERNRGDWIVGRSSAIIFTDRSNAPTNSSRKTSFVSWKLRFAR
ncbi:hypothetical protein J19TS2_10110 [Cohnella xylanilytica]|nr:hypothetical protein J19TS2_10110 [Cohnella xylanilytica]